MKASTLLPEFRTLLTDGPPAVRMVMLYEDGDSGRRARQFAHEVLHGAVGECAGITSFWSFDLLGCRMCAPPPPWPPPAPTS